uniref:Uncharacterized protein n=1 Tax=Panstrongylus lignarius TaxID=156445 RepID=A0A224XSP5_9HEMI
MCLIQNIWLRISSIFRMFFGCLRSYCTCNGASQIRFCLFCFYLHGWNLFMVIRFGRFFVYYFWLRISSIFRLLFRCLRSY